MKLTIQQYADKIGTTYLIASSIIKYLEKKGKIKKVDKISNGKGKPTNVYDIPDSVTITW